MAKGTVLTLPTVCCGLWWVPGDNSNANVLTLNLSSKLVSDDIISRELTELSFMVQSTN